MPSSAQNHPHEPAGNKAKDNEGSSNEKLQSLGKKKKQKTRET
jgi:hypothetical protein